MPLVDQESILKFIRDIVYDDPEKILLFKQKFLTDDIWEIAIDLQSDLFRYIKNPSLKLCYYALSVDGGNLKYIPVSRINDKMIAIASRSNREGARPYIPKKFIDKEHDVNFYADFENGTVDEETIQLSMIRKKPNSIKDIKNPSETLICEAIKLDPMIYLYFNEHTDAMKKVIEEYHPEVTALFPGFNNE